VTELSSDEIEVLTTLYYDFFVGEDARAKAMNSALVGAMTTSSYSNELESNIKT